MDVLVGPTFTLHAPPYHAALSSSSSDASSSIGTPDDTDDENDAVSSKNQQEQEQVHQNLQGLASLDSLEDSLPIKRGLSNHFMGKSKSFTDLSQVNTVKELQKQENPFNKRRRVQIASKWSRKSSFYASSNPKSMPLLPLHEDEDYYQEQEIHKKVSPSSSSSSSEETTQENNQTLTLPHSYVSHMRHRFLGSFKCRSLSDLKEHDEEEDDQDEDENDDD